MSFLKAVAAGGDVVPALAAILLVIFMVAFRSLVAYVLGVKFKDAWAVYCFAVLAQVLLSLIRVPGLAIAGAAATASAANPRRESKQEACLLAPFALEGVLSALTLLLH